MKPDIDKEREAFEAELKRIPEWAPEFEQHRAWVERFAWSLWLARASARAAQDANETLGGETK